MGGRRLFLDCDGVLADFDGGVRKLAGMTPADFIEQKGIGSFWKMLARADGFYAHLDPLPGAEEMVAAVAHLDPVILTGLPMGKWAEPQKRIWAKNHFPGLEVITCMARDKWRYAQAGDVLVDDRIKTKASWEEDGHGVFVHHTSPEDSLAQLKDYFDL